MRTRVDQGDWRARVAVALCACGWRGLGVSRLAALERAADHERVCHPGDDHARKALRAEHAKLSVR